MTQLRGLKQGEIMIVGKRPVRFAGPYVFKPGGYLLRFSQTPTSGERGRLQVSLESRRGSRAEPYQRVVDTTRAKGRARVHVTGKLLVHVKTTSGSYVLRFTPAHAR